MELTAAVTVLGAVVAPFIVAMIVRPSWSPTVKRNVAIGVSVLLGLVIAVATGKVDSIPETVVAWTGQGIIAIGGVTALAQGVYAALKTPLTALEATTSPTPTDTATGN